MYSDFRFCRYCSDVGHYTDGENYCTKCDNYLCLSCSRTHGQNCEYLRHPETNLQSSRSSKVYSESYGDATKNKNANPTSMTQNGSIQHSNTGFDRMTIATNPSNNATEFSKQNIPSGCYGDGKFDGYTKNGAVTVNTQSSAVDRNSMQYNTRPRNTTRLQLKTSNKEPQKPSFSRMPGSGRRESFSDYGGVIRIKKAWTDRDMGQPEGHTLFVCTYHPDRNLENYCKTHNTLCCDECLNTKHNHCTIQPIDEVAQNLKDGRDLYVMKSKLKQLRQACDNTRLKLQQQRLRNAEYTGNINNPCADKVQTCASKPNRNVGNICYNGTEPERAISACNDLQQHISMCQQEINNAEISEIEVNIFIALYKNKTIIESIEKSLQQIASYTNSIGINGNRAVGPDEFNRTVPTWNSTNNSSNVGSDAKVFHRRNVPENTLNNNDDSEPKSYIIGDVILTPCEDPSIHQDDVPEVIYCNYSSSDDDSNERNVNKVTEHTSTVNTNRSVSNSRKSVSSRKYTGMLTNPKDKIKIHGLATEFYMSDSDREVSDDFQILRLHSPTPERTIDVNTGTQNAQIRRQSINDAIEDMTEPGDTDRNRNMVKWQDRKLLESVELRSDKAVKQTNPSISSTKRKKKIFESCESDLKEFMKKPSTCIDKQQKVRHLQTVRKENIRVMTNSKNHRNVKSNTKIKTNKVKYEVETDAIRLKKWIQQTEDMNKAYLKSVSKDSAHREVYKLDTDGVTEVFAANADNVPATDTEYPPFMAIRIKNANLLQNARVSSAKSQASDTDESRYKRQTYACRPRNKLSLYAEHVVRLPNDKVDCKVNGVSCMPDGRVVVSDYNNTNIKLFRVGWSKESVLQLDEPPRDVAVVTNTLLSVITGLAFDRMYLISVAQCMAVKRRFKTGCECKAVSSYQSYIYLLCLYRYKTEVRVLNTDGVVSIRFAFGHVIPSPIGIAVNQMNGLVFISDKTEGVFKCESGRVLSRSFDDNIGEYQHVACDSSNNVYVTTEDPSGIYEVSRDGKHLMPAVQSATIHGANVIAYNEALNVFVVCCSQTGTMCIYSICDTDRH